VSDREAVVPPRPEADGIAVWASGREAAGEWPDAGATLPRTVAAGAVVELREVTKDTVRSICGLQVAPAQRGFVAPNAVSFAEALFDPQAWYRAIVADGVLVGFVMLSLDPDAADYWLWRLMIADGLQRRGYGRRVLDLVADHVRTLPNATRLSVGWCPGPGSPEPLYLGYGFVPTGEIEGDEIVGALAL
jgi:diamine N-acetyltransferase